MRWFPYLVLAGTALAQDIPNSGLPSWLAIGGQIRGRMEAPAGSDFLHDSARPYLLTRLRLNVALRPRKWLTLFAETQDTRALNYDGTPPATMQDPLDLRAAYVEVRSSDQRGVMLRAGRQEIALGNSRLISIGPWSNTSKTFDAIRMAWFRPGLRFEWIAGSLVLADGARFDRHKPGDHFYASYNTLSQLVPHSQLEPYFIARTVVDGTTYTAGLRWAGTFATAFDYSAEMLRQWGTRAASRIHADAGTYTLGWTFRTSPRKPRVSADFSFGSRYLDLLYGNQQPFFSYTGMFCWRNLRTVRAGFDFSLRKNVKAGLDYRDFYLSTVADAWYNSAGNAIVLNRQATSSHIGQGPDTQVSWTIGRYGQVTAGVAQVVAGAYLRQSGKGSGYLYPYLGWSRQFGPGH